MLYLVWGQVICIELKCTVRYRDRYSVLIYSMELGTLGTQEQGHILYLVQGQTMS